MSPKVYTDEEFDVYEREYLAMSEEERFAVIMACQGIWSDRTDEEIDDLLTWRKTGRSLEDLYGPDHFNSDPTV